VLQLQVAENSDERQKKSIDEMGFIKLKNLCRFLGPSHYVVYFHLALCLETRKSCRFFFAFAWEIKILKDLPCYLFPTIASDINSVTL
jgi:hypothetical protein